MKDLAHLEDIEMILKHNLLYILIITSTLLTACGFAKTEQTGWSALATNPFEVEIDEEVIRLYEQSITYSIEGIEHNETVYLNSSTNLPISIYLFKDFRLEAKEPGKDVLIHKENQDVFMSIELFPEDVNFFDLEYTSYKQLNTISDTVQRNVWSHPDPLLKGAVMLHADNEYEWVQILLIKDRADFPNMKLTIHAPTEDEEIEKLLAMAKTIEKKK